LTGSSGSAATIGKHFFPHDDPTVSVVMSFGVFAIGFLACPVGPLVLGHLGYVLGRRKVLMISILMMAGPTFLIGVLPTYDTLSVLAPIIPSCCAWRRVYRLVAN